MKSVNIKVVALLLAVSVVACTQAPVDDDARPPDSPAAASSATLAVPPLTAKQLHLDLSSVPEEVENRGLRGAILPSSTRAFKDAWAKAVPGDSGWSDPRWTQKDLPVVNLVTSEAELAPGLKLTLGETRGLFSAVQVTVKAPAITDSEKIFAAWSGAIAAVGVHESPAELRTVFEGLGLLAKPTKASRRFADQGVEYSVRYRDLTKSLTLEIRPAVPTVAPDASFGLDVPIGNPVPAQKLAAFLATYNPSSRGKDFHGAAAHCREQGLYLCTEAQWRRLCSESPGISSVGSWSSSFDAELKQIRTFGDGSCTSQSSKSASETSDSRGAVCCTGVIAVEANRPMAGVDVAWIAQYQEATNALDADRLSRILDDPMVKFFTVSQQPKVKVIGMAMDYLRANPGTWSVHESCVVEEEREQAVFFHCQRNVFTADTALVTMSEYGVKRSPPSLSWVADKVVLRKRSAF